MILPVNIELDREELLFAEPGGTDTLVAAVKPANALIKDVTWSSSDETVARVDGRGVVTATGEGEAVITAKTVSPYRPSVACKVKVSPFYQVTTEAEHGRITYEPDGPFQKKDRILFTPVPDRGYRLKEGSLKAFKSGDESIEAAIRENTLVMPGHDVTVTAVFEPVVYPITYELGGGKERGSDAGGTRGGEEEGEEKKDKGKEKGKDKGRGKDKEESVHAKAL